MMYGTIIYLFKPLFTKGYYFIEPQNREISVRNKCENVHYWKKQKNIAKNFKLIFSGILKYLKKYSRHNSMGEKCRTLFKYENARFIGWNDWLKTL